MAELHLIQLVNEGNQSEVSRLLKTYSQLEAELSPDLIWTHFSAVVGKHEEDSALFLVNMMTKKLFPSDNVPPPPPEDHFGEVENNWSYNDTPLGKCTQCFIVDGHLTSCPLFKKKTQTGIKGRVVESLVPVESMSIETCIFQCFGLTLANQWNQVAQLMVHSELITNFYGVKMGFM
jgi:hypothetical protein